MSRVSLDVEQVRQLPATHSTIIPEDYLDAMGHMNVMWYTHLFGLGNAGLMQIVGLAWDQLMDQHAGTFALETHIRYLSEVHVGQAITVHSRLLGRTDRRYHSMHFMTNQSKQDVSATFETITAYIDLRVRRMASMPEGVQENLDRLIDEHGQLSWPAPVCGSMAP